MLGQFDELYRTLLIDDRRTVVQQWTSSNISWVTGFLHSKFVIDLKKDWLVVIVLSQVTASLYPPFRHHHCYLTDAFYPSSMIATSRAFEASTGSISISCSRRRAASPETTSVASAPASSTGPSAVKWYLWLVF